MKLFRNASFRDLSVQRVRVWFVHDGSSEGRFLILVYIFQRFTKCQDTKQDFLLFCPHHMNAS